LANLHHHRQCHTFITVIGEITMVVPMPVPVPPLSPSAVPIGPNPITAVLYLHHCRQVKNSYTISRSISTTIANTSTNFCSVNTSLLPLLVPVPHHCGAGTCNNACQGQYLHQLQYRWANTSTTAARPMPPSLPPSLAFVASLHC